jgi:hypothetical protein
MSEMKTIIMRHCMTNNCSELYISHIIVIFICTVTHNALVMNESESIT